MKNARFLPLALALCGATVAAQSVRNSSEAFPIPQAPLQLPVAPLALPMEPPRPAPVPLVSPVAVPTQETVGGSWEIKPTDVRLDKVLERWAKAAGWRVQWDAAKHVELSGPNTFTGAFELAVGQVLGTPGIRMSEYPLEGCIYPNNPPLIRITRMGEQVNECPEEHK